MLYECRLFAFVVYLGLGCHVVHNPRVGTYNTTFTDGHAAKHGGVGVDDHVVLDNRVAWDALDRIAVLVERKTLGTECHTLIELDVISNDTGLPDDYTRTVVDGERGADGCSGMDVHTGLGVSDLCHHARNQGHAHRKQFVRHTKDGQRLNDRIAGQDLCDARRCRITVVGGHHVGGEDAAHSRQTADEFRRHLLGLLLECFQVFEDAAVCSRLLFGVLVAVGKAQSGQNLLGEQLLQPLHVHANLIFDGLNVDLRLSKIAGKENGARQLDNLLKRRA